MKHRCLDCKHCTSWPDRREAGVFSDLCKQFAECRQSLRVTTEFNPVAGEWIKEEMLSCIKLNKDGECRDFEARPKPTWWQKFWGLEPK